jgi:hypothetical protein
MLANVGADYTGCKTVGVFGINGGIVAVTEILGRIIVKVKVRAWHRASCYLVDGMGMWPSLEQML